MGKLTTSQRKALFAKNNIKVGKTVNVFVSPDEPRRRIKITQIHDTFKGDSEGGITGRTKDGSLAWARTSQIIKLKLRKFKK